MRRIPATWSAPAVSLEQEEVEGEEEGTGAAIGTIGGAGSFNIYGWGEGKNFDYRICLFDHGGAGLFVHTTVTGDVNMVFRSRGYVVKLNGLPFRASEREVEDWLAEAADPVEVIIEMDRLALTSCDSSKD